MPGFFFGVGVEVDDFPPRQRVGRPRRDRSKNKAQRRARKKSRR